MKKSNDYNSISLVFNVRSFLGIFSNKQLTSTTKKGHTFKRGICSEHLRQISWGSKEVKFPINNKILIQIMEDDK